MQIPKSDSPAMERIYSDNQKKNFKDEGKDTKH